MHGYGFSGSAERRRRRPHADSSKSRRLPGLGMDVLETRMLLAAGIISSQSWQLPATYLPRLANPAPSLNATIYSVPGTDKRVIAEPIPLVNNSVASTPKFAVRIIS